MKFPGNSPFLPSLGLLALGLACGGTPHHEAAPTFTVQPASQTVPALGTATFTVAAAGDPTPTLAWARSDDHGATWSPIAGATASTYQFTVRATDNGAEFMATATNAAAATPSVPAVLTEVPAVYAGGTTQGTGAVPTVWVNGTSSTLPGTDGEVHALAVNGSLLLAGGSESNATGSFVPGYWSGGQWVGLPVAVFNGTGLGSVSALAVSGSDVYAGGFNVDPYSYAAVPGYWKNGAWVTLPLPTTVSPVEGAVTALAVSGTDLYAGGYFNGAGTAAGPALWVNGTLTPLPGTPGGMITTLAVAGADVYAAGGGQVAGPGYWLNGAWVGLPLPADGSMGAVNALLVSGSDVYAAGFYLNAGGYVPGYWLNGAWVGLPLPQGSGYGVVSALVVSGGQVLAGGWVGDWTDSPQNAFPGTWVDGTWTALPVPDGARYSYLNGLVRVP